MDNNKELNDMKVAARLFKKSINHSCQQLVSEYFKTPTTQAESEKVTNTVGTFLKGVATEARLKGDWLYLSGRRLVQVVSEYVKVSDIQETSEKVDTTVTTFLPDNRNGMHIIRVMTKAPKLIHYKNGKIESLFYQKAKGQFKIKNIQKILWTNMWIQYV